jgi:hypothetical protein
MSDVLNAWSLPQRDEVLVTLFSDARVEIVQTNAVGEESQPVRIDSWDLPELIELLDLARRYEPPTSETTPTVPKPSLETVSAAPAKKKGPPAAG